MSDKVYTEGDVGDLVELKRKLLEQIKKDAPGRPLLTRNYVLKVFCYWNFDYSAVCIECYTSKYGNEPAECVMLHKAALRAFRKNPDWTLFRNVVVDAHMKDFLFEALDDLHRP